MKKIILSIAGALALLLVAFVLLAPRLLGFSASHLDDAVAVATGMGAKLACSGRYISGFSPEQNLADLESYSPANALLDLAYDDASQQVTATLFGMAKTRSRFRPGLGCTLEIGDTTALDRIPPPALATTAAPWPAGQSAPAIDSELQQQLDALLAEDNAAGRQTRALVVIQDGVLVAESYAAGITPQTPLLGWSMGKSVTAMMLGRMAAMGLATTDTSNLFEAWREDERKNITLEHLLQMSSGLDFDETYAPGSDATRMLFLAHSASDVALSSGLAHMPGSHFSYSSGTTNLLARWITEQLGSPAQSADFLRTKLLAPLGMEHTVFEMDPSGVFVGSSYIYASARDWARLGQLMLNRGKWNGEQILGTDWVTRASTPNHSSNQPAYGYQFWLNRGSDDVRFPQLPEDAYFMLGNRKQAVMVSPSTNTVVVRLGWSSGEYPTGENFARLLPANS